jgi:NADH-quinone oxidoreductase subunit A
MRVARRRSPEFGVPRFDGGEKAGHILARFRRRVGGAARVTQYYREYLAVAVLIGAGLLMVGGMLGLGKLVRPSRPQPDKYVTYEAGSDPVGGWGQSNVRYYVYALLFVMFDVEAVFIFPWATRVEALGVQSLVSMIVFIVVLTLGLVYAWRKGVLRWA